MKSFDDLRNDTREADLLTEDELYEGLLRKGASVGLFTKSSGHRKAAQQHFANARGYLRSNAGTPLEKEIQGQSLAIKELTEGLSQLSLQIGALGSISLTAVLLQDKSSRTRKRR